MSLLRRAEFKAKFDLAWERLKRMDRLRSQARRHGVAGYRRGCRCSTCVAKWRAPVPEVRAE